MYSPLCKRFFGVARVTGVLLTRIHVCRSAVAYAVEKTKLIGFNAIAKRDELNAYDDVDAEVLKDYLVRCGSPPNLLLPTAISRLLL